jgi:hypothetical protein
METPPTTQPFPPTHRNLFGLIFDYDLDSETFSLVDKDYTLY